MKNILLVEDEKEYGDILASFLNQKGFSVTHLSLGKQALEKIEQNQFGLVILDLGLPDTDGLNICRQIRKTHQLPILILTAKDEVETKISGFNLGADDYMVKPVSLNELIVRINRLLKRNLKTGFRSAIFQFNTIKFNTVSGLLSSEVKSVKLTKKEKGVLEYLLLNKGQVLTRMEVMDHVWGSNLDSFSRTLDMVISSLRRKLKKISPKKFIQSVHGLGYRLETYENHY
jgi:two-component system OmpR family response regulator